MFEFQDGIQYIKIFGLQRSGTNYLTDLINRNFKNTRVLVNIGGWKHGTYCAPYVLGQEVDVVVLVKNPYSWLRSVYEYWGPNRKKNIGPDLRSVAFEQFVRSRAVFEQQRGIPFLYRAANPIQYWNNMCFHWISVQMESKRCVMVSYETLLSNFDLTMLRLTDIFDLSPMSDSLEYTSSTKVFEPSEEEPNTSDEDFAKSDYYTQRGYMRYYSQDLIEFVNSQLDRDVMSKCGYNLERA